MLIGTNLQRRRLSGSVRNGSLGRPDGSACSRPQAPLEWPVRPGRIAVLCRACVESLLSVHARAACRCNRSIARRADFAGKRDRCRKDTLRMPQLEIARRRFRRRNSYHRCDTTTYRAELLAVLRRVRRPRERHLTDDDRCTSTDDPRAHQTRRRPRLDRQHRHERAGGDRRERGPAAGGRPLGPSAARSAGDAGPSVPPPLGHRHRRSGGRPLPLERPAAWARSCSSASAASRKSPPPKRSTSCWPAIVGSAGLRSTWAALEAKKTVALANKETLVMGGAAGHASWPPSAARRSCRSTASTARFFRPCRPAAARKSPASS